MDTANLLWGLLFSSIGFAYFVYGKKQRTAVPLATGVALMAYPFFVEGPLLMPAIGAGLTALPYFVRL